MSQFTPFEIGQIKAHVYHGLSGAAISRILVKPDGKTGWSETAIQVAIEKLAGNIDWRGDRQSGSGAPRVTSKAEDKIVEREVLKSRGKHKVTVAYLQKMFLWARKLSNDTLEDRLHEAGLKWLRRRGKTIVTKKYLKPRVDYCRAIILKHQVTLNGWAYTDGTVFYLDRTEDDVEHSQRASLGGWVWRRADGRDAMFQECLGPSSYKKAQGIPVRVWGVLAQGVLSIVVLDLGEVMNQELYAELIEDRFEEWLRGSSLLVQDFERCLRSEGPMHALGQMGVELVQGYPKVSQDFNAIENCWKLLRARLCTTMPTHLESRDDFVDRLKMAVQWLNRYKGQEMWNLGTNQKERCRECLASKPMGARTKW